MRGCYDRKILKMIIANMKKEIISTQIKTIQEVNSNLIKLYFRLGKKSYQKIKFMGIILLQVSTELKLTFSFNEGIFGKKY